MKFTLLFIGLMLLKGIELHRHKHGHRHEPIQDDRIKPKPGTYENKLVAKYGTNFRYLGKVKNGLGRVTVVTSIPIPRFDHIKVQPINFAKCAEAMENDNKDGKHLITADTQASKAAKEWCARATPYIEYLQQQEKYYVDR